MWDLVQVGPEGTSKLQKLWWLLGWGFCIASYKEVRGAAAWVMNVLDQYVGASK